MPDSKTLMPYEPQPFPRTEVAAELVKRYPWVDPKHAENPMQRFFTQKAKGVPQGGVLT
jgi:hypothetical protein